MGTSARLASALLLLVLASALPDAAAQTACSFTLGSTSASLTQIGTASAGGVLPEAPVTVAFVPAAGALCSPNFTVTSSSPWLSATSGPNGFTYTALTNPQPSPRGAALTVTNPSGGSATFTVIESGDPEPLLNRQVRALYQSVLGRDPDATGFTFWTGQGSAGLGEMLDSFLTSPEAFNSDFAVMAAYQAATDAPPTYAQFMAAAASIRAGTETIGGLFNSLVPNNFIIAIYTVQNLYQNLLQRAPSSSEIESESQVGLAGWFQTLIAYPSSTTPVSAPNNEFMSTGTFAKGADHTNALYVALLYYVILGRDLDQAGYGFWLGVANGGGPGLLFQGPQGYPTRIQILGPGTPNQGFAGSPEFQSLFQAPSNPAPAITSLSPPSASVGSGPVTLTIDGTGFNLTSTVTFNAASHAVTFVSPSLLTITLSAADLSTVGSFPVVVANPAPGGGSSPAAAFAVQTANPVPAITSLSPSSALAFAGPVTLTVNGSGFINASTVTFNGVAHAVSLVSAHQLTITLSPQDLSAAGASLVVVTNPAPGGGSSPAATFTVQANNPVPAITSLSPFFTNVAAGPLTLTIDGNGFVPSSQASFNGVSHAVTFIGANQLGITLSTADLSTVGIFPVVVTNPAPGGGSSAESPFTVQPNNPVPSITNLSPSSAKVATGPLTLTIDGTGFLPSSTATFSGTSHTVSFLSPTQVTITLSTADLSTVGSYMVVVTDPAPGGGNSPAATFTVQPTNTVPAITSLSPPSAQAGAGPLILTVVGTGFTTTSTATFNAVSHAVSFDSANQLAITLSPSDLSTAGGFQVVVTNPPPAGGSSPPATFIVQPNNPVPFITGLSPSTAAAGVASFTLTVNGGNFVQTSAIQWNGTSGQPPLATSYVSPTQLTVTIPAADIATAGAASVTVVNPAPVGGTSAAASFSISGTIPNNVSFVAPNGNDSNPGTIGRPYLTIQKCATTVASGGTCALRAGTYYETVTPNSGITITSYDGEPVTVDGTNAVTGWSLYQGSIYTASVVMSTGDTNQVFVGSQMMTEARWPNGNDLFNVNWATAQTGTTTSLLVDPNLPNIDWTGATVHLWSGNDAWGHMTGTVTASGAQQLTMSVPTDWCPSICPAAGGYYYLFGILGALDTQDEWFYDPTKTLLYFWAPGGVNPNTLSVRAKQRQYAFDLSGKSNVTIQHINLFATSVNMDSSSTGNVLEGIGTQYVSHFTTLPAPAEWLSHLTDTGIIINGTGNTLQDSAIAYSAGDGVALMGSNNSTRNNLIHDTGYMGAYSSGINMFGPNNAIENNTIYTSGRFQVYMNSTIAPNNNDDIGFNNLFEGMLLTVDGGEIYTDTSGPGVQIHQNWIHNTWPPVTPPTAGHPNSGTYIDEDASGYSIYQNILWNNEYGNVFLHGLDSTAPNDNNVYNNTIPDVAYLGFIWLQDIATCGTTQVTDNLVFVPVTQINVNPPCTATNNSPTAPGATEMNSSVQVGCNFAGCSSSGPPAIAGNLVAASVAIQPVSVSVAAGQVASFTVTAAGSAPISYQWQRNGVNIGGAIFATYTTLPTASTDDGAVFTVVVSNSVGGATSNPAVLTVN
jgi:hypothetical protein